MFDNIRDSLSSALRHITGKAKLSEDNIKLSLQEVRKSLLAADVALPVVTSFISSLTLKLVGVAVPKGLDPSQFVIKVVNDELTQLMGSANVPLNLNVAAPVVILVAGLQGAGKTTTVAKLAKWLQEQHKKSVSVASCDVYRPAAIEQLQVVAEQVGANFIPHTAGSKPVDIAKRAVSIAAKQSQDIVIIDTAGRLHVDADMMSEIGAISKAINPAETILVADSMLGQDAVNMAKAFNDALAITGIILSKIDGDTRGGAALSIREVTGAPIKFLGVGEALDALELFHPERIASRILGMGDVLSLVEEIEQKVDKKEAAKLSKKIQQGRGRGFNFNDLAKQLQQMQSMGGMASMLDKMPGLGNMSEVVKQKMNQDGGDVHTKQMLAAINSMTRKERENPALVENKGARKRRIANGSGTSIQLINKLVKQLKQMQKMMKKMSGKGGMQKMLHGLQGKLPPGMFSG